MPTDNKALTRRWFAEVWNEQRPDAIDALLAPDGIAYGLGGPGGEVRGPEAFKAFHARFIGAFPDLKITVDEVLAEGDRVAVRFTGTGTHRGDHLGIPASGRRVTFTGMSFTRWKDGQIAEGWNNVDIAGMLQQVGALPAIEDLG